MAGISHALGRCSLPSGSHRSRRGLVVPWLGLALAAAGLAGIPLRWAAAEPTAQGQPGAADVQASAASPNDDAWKVTPPPPEVVQRLDLSPFYQKHLAVGGLSIVGSADVPDAALAEAAWLVRQMLGPRTDILQAMARQRVRLVVMAHTEMTTDIPEHSDLKPRDYWDRRARGLGASRRRPAVSCGAENLLGYPGDPYATENILIHEFGHAIHQMGLREVDPTFDDRLKAVYEQSLAAGRWKGTYAATNKEEFWAEGVQSWFDTNRENDHEHNHVNTREELKEYDPPFARLLEEIFGDGPWRYTRPHTRRNLPHLAGWNPDDNPRFRWPQAVLARYRAFQQAASGAPLGDESGWHDVPLSPPDRLDELRSPASNEAAVLLLVNQRSVPVQVEWISFDGRLRPAGVVAPGGYRPLDTFRSHLFLLRCGEDRLGIVAAASERCRAVVSEPATNSPKEATSKSSD